MEITRTANAGVLLKLDGVSMLLDGVCREVKPYPATPPQIREVLSTAHLDVLAFTHGHKDHYDPVFAAEYQRRTNGVVLGPADLPSCKISTDPFCLNGVQITTLESRHIGLAGKTVSHVSFVIKGSQCVWFLGDSSPLVWKGREDLPRPDVLIVPYAYATTRAGWAVTQALDPKWIVLLHLPDTEADAQELWDAVKSTAGEDPRLQIPKMGAKFYLT